MQSATDVIATVGVRELAVARNFYEGRLGFEPIESDDQNYISYKTGHTQLLVYRSQFAGDYEATVATWEVGSELDELVALFKNAGVNFEHYELPATTRKGDIHIAGKERTAWFKDPDGNILCLANR